MMPPTPVAADNLSGDERQAIKAPFVGYFRAANPPIKAGQELKKGQVIGSIEALGIPNDVESSAGGVVDEVLVKDGEAVEFGQPIALLRSAS